jgi:hypothetical protein
VGQLLEEGRPGGDEADLKLDSNIKYKQFFKFPRLKNCINFLVD